MTGIYKIESRINPKRIYIGSAIRIEHRWECHVSDLRLSKHHSKKLQRHFNKYGLADLQFSFLLGCNKEDLIKTEQYFLDLYNPYFNNRKVADNNSGIKYNLSDKQRQAMRDRAKGNKNGLGYKHTDEEREKISKALKGKLIGKKHPFYGKHLSVEHKKKISESEKGKKMSDESRQKIREYNIRTGKKPPSHKGEIMPDEQKRKIGEANKISQIGNKNASGRKHTEQEIQKMQDAWKLRKLKKSA
jgi:group I intron endonuclease